MYNSLISGTFKARKLGKVTDLLAEMHERRLTPTVVTYGALIAGWCREGMLDIAFSVYFEMTEKGLAPNMIIYSAIISGLYRLGRTDEANMLLQKIMDFGEVLDHKFFDKYIKSDTKRLDVLCMANFLDKSVKTSLLPNDVVYNVAIAGLCKSVKADDARRFVTALLLRGFVPDNFTYTTLIHGFSVAGDVDEAFNLRDEMLEKGLQGDTVEAEKLLDQLTKSGMDPNLVTSSTMVQGYIRHGDIDKFSNLHNMMCMRSHDAVDIVNKQDYSNYGVIWGFQRLTEFESGVATVQRHREGSTFKTVNSGGGTPYEGICKMEAAKKMVPKLATLGTVGYAKLQTTSIPGMVLIKSESSDLVPNYGKWLQGAN
ncbi:hypothetical protein RJ639_039548 [Escallonia herrerae]|uniref:Pentatricopeptide repeat-containing protein n=1 Tax=Escallonia herrerae TaxID=1293975 RepID=A0AA88WT84_9ASTE|nr:hypothetical protein RJ639_039548 [Escallonia herrerae]